MADAIDIAPAVPDLPPLRDVIARHGLAAVKALGQHFLLDLNLTRRIARVASAELPGGLTEGTTIEIGPGPGGLTRALLIEGATTVVAVEKDARCVVALDELVAAFPGRLTVIQADALEVDVSALGPAPRRIVANLPYNVASRLLIGWLDAIVASRGTALVGMLLMFQKEVAERLAAAPRRKAYGRLSVAAQTVTTVAKAMTLPAAAFTPPPQVDSAVARLVPHASLPSAEQWAAVQDVTAAAFGQRRKMLRQSLQSLGADAGALLAAAGVPETARAEELDVAAFDRLASALRARRAGPR
ncbi:MAG: 16S rRNA (adenine(1518)-N(6)/adenine(1519)-N(6))-dimethyltransferase RsmA [Alphaproteobacteria bacterium]|nr:16S rRNA (adenine(1518)-N(6)/adenine(1519)-N(6))-dimethyltransferase RsmA [Alphaproteobacteria bacterium]